MRFKHLKGFTAGAGIGSLGGMIGLGGAEFRLPLLVAYFRIPTLQAIILNKASSLIVVAVAIFSRQASISWTQIWPQNHIVLNLLIGSLVGAWWAAGKAIKLSPATLKRVVFVLLAGLGCVMLAEASFPFENSGGASWFANSYWLTMAGVLAGLVIGIDERLLMFGLATLLLLSAWKTFHHAHDA